MMMMMVDDIESLDDIYVSLEEEQRARDRNANPHATPTQTALEIMSGVLGMKDSPPKPIPIQHLPGDNDTTLLDDPTIVQSVPIRNPQMSVPAQHHHTRSSSRARYNANERGREGGKERERIEAHSSTPKKSSRVKDSIRGTTTHRKHTTTRRMLEELNAQLQLHDPVPSITQSQRDREGKERTHGESQTGTQSQSQSQHAHNTTKDIPIPSIPYSRARTYTTTGRSSDSISTMLAVTAERLAQETRRGDEAEKQAGEVLRLLREVVEGKARVEREVRGLRDERELWRVRLEEAQAEIYRAQNVVAQIDKQRVDAESEAKRLRDRLRKVYEERAVENARDEGRQAGFDEGLKQGRLLGFVSSKGREQEEEDERERRRKEFEERRRREEEELRREEEEENKRLEEEREKAEKRRKEEDEKKREKDKKRRDEAERIARERLREQEKKTETVTQSSKDSVKNLRPRRASTAHNPHHPPPLPPPPPQPNLKPSFPVPITMPQPSTTSPPAPAAEYPNPLPRPPLPTTPPNGRSTPKPAHTAYIPMMRPDSTFNIPPAHGFVTPTRSLSKARTTTAAQGVPRKSTAQREAVQLRDPGYSVGGGAQRVQRGRIPGERESERGVYANPRLRDEEAEEERERERERAVDRERRYAVVGVSSSAAWGTPGQTETEVGEEGGGRDTILLRGSVGDSTRFSEMQMLASPRERREEGLRGMDPNYRQKVVYGRPSTRDRDEDEEGGVPAGRTRTRSEVDPNTARQWRVANGSPSGDVKGGGIYGNPLTSRRNDTNEQTESSRRNYTSPTTASSRPVVLPVPLMNTLVGANFAPTTQQSRRNPLSFDVQPARSPRIGGAQAMHGSSYSPHLHQRQDLAAGDHIIQMDGPRRRLQRSGSNVSDVPVIEVETPSSHGDHGMHLEHDQGPMNPVMLTPEMHSSPLPTTQEVTSPPQQQQQQGAGLGLYTQPAGASSHHNPTLRVDTNVGADGDRDAKLITGVVHDGNFPPGFVPLSPIPLFGEDARGVIAG